MIRYVLRTLCLIQPQKWKSENKKSKCRNFLENDFIIMASQPTYTHWTRPRPALWNCFNEIQELNMSPRNTQMYFLRFMAEAHCQNKHGIICTVMSVLCLYLLKATGYHRYLFWQVGCGVFLWEGGCFCPFLMVLFTASRSCESHTFSAPLNFHTSFSLNYTVFHSFMH